jgi:hypothetical protein
MPYFETNPDEIEVDVDEFVSACDPSEIEEMIDCLILNGYLPQSVKRSINSNINPKQSLASSEFDEAVSKLFGNYCRLTNEDTDDIMKVANKL